MAEDVQFERVKDQFMSVAEHADYEGMDGGEIIRALDEAREELIKLGYSSEEYP